MIRKTTIIAAMCGISLAAAAQNDAEKDSLAMQRHDVIVVTGTREPTLLRQLPNTITTVTSEQLAATYNTSILPTVMDLTPGLFSTSRGVIGYGVSTNAAGGIRVRGVGNGSNLLVVIDGQPQYAGLMGHPIPDAYIGSMTEKVEILRGPSSVLYGSNAMGGVINIVTKKALEDGYKGSATVSAGSYGTVQAENTNLIRSGKFSAIANINYQRTDGHRPNSDFEQVAGFLKLGYDFSNNWKASADIDLTNFNFMNPGPTTAPLLDAEAKITRGLASVSVSNAYGKTNGTIRAFYDWGHHNIDDGHTADKDPRDYLYKHDDFIGGVTAFQNFQFFTGNNTTFGFDYQYFGGDAWQMLKSNGTHKSDYNTENQDDIAGYIDIRQAITGLVTLDFGLRVDHHSQVGTEIVPQGGIVFHFTNTQDVKLLVSKGFANPVIRDMYMFPPHNDKLEPERMMNYELAYFKRATNGTFGANIFIVDGKNMISTAPNPSGAGMLNQNVCDFHNYGFEVEGDYTFGRWWTINANYSYLHMKKPVTGAPEGKLYLGATYRHGSWNANVNIENISGLYITTGDDPEKENYTTLNCSLGYNVSQNVRLFVRANNIFAERYETYAGFPMPKATFMGGVKVDFGN